MGNLGEPAPRFARRGRTTPMGAVVRCALAALLFGATTPLAAELADDLGAFRLAGLLYLGAALVVAPGVLGRRVLRSVGEPSPHRHRHHHHHRRRDRSARAARHRAGARLRRSRPLVVVVVAGGLVGPVLLAAGLARTSSATAALLLNLELAATTALAAAVFREPVARRSAAGASLVAVAGAALVWSAPLPWTGALLVVAACGCWAVDDCATVLLEGVTPQQVTLAKGVLAGGVNLAVGLVAAGLPAAGPALLALGVGAAGYGVSIALWIGGARDLGPERAPLVFASAPFAGAVVAWTAFDQPITGPQLVAGVLAAVGVALVAVPARRPERRFAAFDPESGAFSADILDDADLDAVEGAGHYGYMDEYDDLFDEGLVPLRRSG